MPVESDASGAVYECTARVAGDEIDRPGVPRFKGSVVQGNKVGRYLELAVGKFNSQTSKIAKVIGAAKVPLIDNGTRAARSVQQWITHDMVREASESGGYLYGGVVGPFHETGSATLLGQGWYVVRGGDEPPALRAAASAESTPATAAPRGGAGAKAPAGSSAGSAAAAAEAPFDVLVRVTCRPAPPSAVKGTKVLSGLQPKDARRDLLGPISVSGTGADSVATFELPLRVSGEEIGRPGFPRFTGRYVWGNKSGRFLKLMLLSAKQPRGGSAAGDIAGGVKVLLTHNGTRAAKATKGWITMDMARAARDNGSCLAASVVGPPEAATSTPLLGEGWQVGASGTSHASAGATGSGGGSSAAARSKRKRASRAGAQQSQDAAAAKQKPGKRARARR